MLSFINNTSEQFNKQISTGIFSSFTASKLPVRAGDYLPSFLLYNEQGLWLSPQPISFSAERLLNRPLILVFYSSRWKSAAKETLQRLQFLREEAGVSQTTVLVISAEIDAQLIREASTNAFNLYHDPDNRIASRFGLYSEEEPSWTKYSGLEHNAALLASYVISEDGLVVFDYVEDVFEKAFQPEKFWASLRRTRGSKLA